MAKDNSSQATETATPVSDAAVQLAAAKAAAKLEREQAIEAKRAVHGAQTQAREVLSLGLAEAAKACRKFISAQGTDASEKTAELVRAIMGVIPSA